MSDLLEVRVFGALRVRTRDGSIVDPRSWRTTKTRDLLRLLAISAGEVVPVDAILDALWPAVPQQRGRASLRTAASQIRHVVGDGHLERRTGGLVLNGAWVDAQAFASLATRAIHLLGSGDQATGVARAWEAVHLYSGELCEDEPYAEWPSSARERYRQQLHHVLLDAAEAAHELGWLRDASEFGNRALRIDPSAERAYRILIRIHAHLGETEQALGLFERCRRVLSEEYGADPSAETRAVHLEVLRSPGTPPRVSGSPFVGRERSLSRVTAMLTEVLEEARPAAIVVSGPAGSGRTRFVQEVVQHWPHRVVEVRCTPGAGEGQLIRDVAAACNGEATDHAPTDPVLLLPAHEPLLVVVEDLQWTDERSVTALGQALAGPGALVLLATDVDEWAGQHRRLLNSVRCEHILLAPMTQDELALLLTPVLAGQPSAELVEELWLASKGLPSAAITAACHLRNTGQLIATPRGIVRVEEHTGNPPAEAETRLALARQQAGAAGSEIIDLLAVLNRWISGDELARFLGESLSELSETLNQLSDLGVVVKDSRGFRLIDVFISEAAYRWLRPSARRALHRMVAEDARLPAAGRIDHWLLSGEPALACAAALEAADEALGRGDDAQVQVHLLAVNRYAEQNAIGAEDRIVLVERLAAAEERLGRISEARDLLEEAIALARSSYPAALARLHQGLGRLARTPRDALLAYDRAARMPGISEQESRSIALSVASATTGTAPDTAIDLLHRSIEQADAAGDLEAQIGARALLARAAGQQREFPIAMRAGKAALTLAEATGDVSQFVRAAHALCQIPAFLGDGLASGTLLQRAYERSVAARESALSSEVGLTYCLVLHELGSSDFHRVWAHVQAGTNRGRYGQLRQLLDALFTLERGQIARARRLLGELPLSLLQGGLADDCVGLIAARLAEARGDSSAAIGRLTAIVHDRDAAGPHLLVPEAAARLALLLAPENPIGARRNLRLAVRLAGDTLYPREQVCILRARAALLAAEGRNAPAATLALAASMAAGRAGLVFQQAAACQQRRDLLGSVTDDRSRDETPRVSSASATKHMGDCAVDPALTQLVKPPAQAARS